MTEKNRTDVIIDGRKFKVVGDGDEEYILRLAKYVDKNIKDLSNKNNFLSQTMSATLAALNITDELFKAKIELENLDKESKEPLEQYANVKTQLKSSNEEINKKESECEAYKDTILSLNREKSKLEKALRDCIRVNSEMEEKVKSSEITIKSLEDKNFQNQIEIVEIKKELFEYVKLLEAETDSQ